MAPNERENVIKSSETQLAIVSALKEFDGATISQIADELELAPSTAYRHVQTLKEHRYVVKDGDEYEVGLRYLDLGGYARTRFDSDEQVRSLVDKLANETNEFVSFIGEEHGLGYFLYINRQGVPSDARVGKLVPLHQSAGGKAILAELDEDRREAIIDRHGLKRKTEETVTDRETLATELENAVERGYATVEGDHTPSLWGVGAAVTRPDGSVLGGITIAGPAYRLRGERIEEEIPQLLLGSLKEFELQLTHS